jgi:branched-chain amino acid transport system substrate-binding protein
LPAPETYGAQQANLIIDCLKNQSVSEELLPKTAAFIYIPEDFWATRYMDGFRNELVRLGLSIVAMESFYEGQTDFTAELLKIKAKNPDAIFIVASRITQSQAIVRQMHELDINPKLIWVADAANVVAFVPPLGNLAEGILSSGAGVPARITREEDLPIWLGQKYNATKLCGEDFVNWLVSKNQVNKKYDSSRHGRVIATVQLLTEAIYRAGTLDREKVRETLNTMEMVTVWWGWKADPNTRLNQYNKLTLGRSKTGKCKPCGRRYLNRQGHV